MATPAQWLAGRPAPHPPAAVAPVLAGTGGRGVRRTPRCGGRPLLALVVALALQVGVNYANDYSDGVRGTDDGAGRPAAAGRLGRGRPAAVKRAAFASFGVAAAVGLVLAATTAWWLVAVGAVCIVAAWFYTGGPRRTATRRSARSWCSCSSDWSRCWARLRPDRDARPGAAWYAAVGIGALACAILVANNLRDIPTDTAVGKRTLAVGARRRSAPAYLYASWWPGRSSRWSALALDDTWWALLGAGVPAARRAWRCASCCAGTTGRGLVPVLAATGAAELLYGAGVLRRAAGRLRSHRSGGSEARFAHLDAGWP